ncbi:MAG: hypothetical protein CM1200mP10_02500 [Candidatus Neomarinimicrobiota bacterium]|nr:MAG: hypothetical protein CM1200mP10_02500 [Candidatus Neomarinimicrobiota bacterium]
MAHLKTFVSCPAAVKPKVSTTVTQYQRGLEGLNSLIFTKGVSIVVTSSITIVSPPIESTADNNNVGNHL